MLPTKEELIGLKNFEQQEDEETDTVIYSFRKFIDLCMKGTPNVLEMLGNRTYLIFNEVGQQLLDKAKIFLSKNIINTFGGYAISQLRRIENALCHDEYDEKEQLKHMTQTMNVAMNKLKDKNELFFDDSIKVKIKDDKLMMKINCKYQPIGLIRATLNDILTIEHTYDKLNQRNKKKDENHLDKHLMHLCRLYLMSFDILEKQEINTYRDKDREFLLEIREGKFIKDKKMTEECREYIDKLEKKLKELSKSTKLPDKPKYKEIASFVIEVHEKVVNNTIKIYNEPLEIISL